ncbi:MAG: hypothetical protein JXA42_08250 [Anaerolineales bacterium]|nr:hypothetical protein [Anaerolineales bacterium]
MNVISWKKSINFSLAIKLMITLTLMTTMLLAACGSDQPDQPPAAQVEPTDEIVESVESPATEAPPTEVPPAEPTLAEVPTEEPALPEEAEALVIGTTDKVWVLDPAEAYDFQGWETLYNTADTLLHFIPGTTELEPGLATGMPEISDDGLEYTFHLVQNAKFPDGTPFTAEAVKWTIDRVMALQGQVSWMVVDFVDHVAVVDEYTVTFVLKAPVNYWLLLVATPPYAPGNPNCLPADSIDPDNVCGGIGPYKIARWERDVELVLEAYDGYPGKAPQTPRIIKKYYADATTLRLALESGEVSIAARTLNPTDYADLEDRGDMQIFKIPSPLIRDLCFSENTPPFDQVEVRQAISYAVDRDAITSIAFQGSHEPLYSMVPMGMWSHVDAFPNRDLDKAQELLSEAGYSSDNKLAMDLWWTPTHYGPTEADMATVLKDNLEETGMIEVTMQSPEWATFLEYRDAGAMPVHLIGWFADYLDPDNYTWPWGHSTGNQRTYYSNPEMDALLEAGREAVDVRSDERKTVYENVQTLWAEDVITVPLTQGTEVIVARSDIAGILTNPNMHLHFSTLAIQ